MPRVTELATAGLLCRREAAPALQACLQFGAHWTRCASWRLRDGAPLRHRPAPEVCNTDQVRVGALQMTKASQMSTGLRHKNGTLNKDLDLEGQADTSNLLEDANSEVALPGESVNLCHLQPESANFFGSSRRATLAMA